MTEQVVLEFVPSTAKLNLDEIAKGVNDELNKIGKGKGDFLQGVADGIAEETKEIEKLKKQVDQLTKSEAAANKELEKFTKSMNQLSQGIAGGAIKQGTDNIEKIGTAATKTATEATKLTTQLRALREQLGRLDEGSAEFEKLSIEAAKLEDRIGDVSQRIRTLSSDTFAIDAVVDSARAVAGAFAIAQGAAALFGDENKDLQKALLKVQASLAVLNGLQETANFITGQSAGKIAIVSAAQKAYTLATNLATTATRGFSIALAATGIGAFIVSIGLLITYWDDLKDAINGATDAQEDWREINKARAEYLDRLDEQKRKELENARIAREAADGGIADIKRTIKFAEELGKTEEQVFTLKQLLRNKELEELKIQEKEIQDLRGLTNLERENAINEISILIKDKEAEIYAATRRSVQAVKELAKEADIIFDPNAPNPVQTALEKFSKTKTGKGTEIKLEPKVDKVDIPKQVGEEAGRSFGENFIGTLTQPEFKDAAINALDDISSTIFAIGQERRKREFEADLASLSKRREAELANKELTESQRLAIDKKYKAQERQLRIKQFNEEKEAKRQEAILNGFLAITTTIAKFGAPVPPNFAAIAAIASVALTTALNVARISATKPPAFKKGTKNAPGGMALVGEEGAELMHVPRGAKIVPHAETMKVLSGHPDTNEILSRFNIPVTSAKVETLKKEFSGYDFSRLEKIISKTNKNFPQVNVDKNGIVTIVNEANSSRTYYGQRYSSR